MSNRSIIDLTADDEADVLSPRNPSDAANADVESVADSEYETNDTTSTQSDQAEDSKDEEGYSSEASDSTLDEFLGVRRERSVAVNGEVIITHSRWPPPDYYGPGTLDIKLDYTLRTVQLRDDDLLRVKTIIEVPSPDEQGHSEFYLRGWRFKAHAKSNSKLSEHEPVADHLKEVYMHLDIDDQAVETDLITGMVTVPVKDAARNVGLIITNKPRDQFYNAANLPEYLSRWIIRSKIIPSKPGSSAKPKLVEQSIAQVRSYEADKEHRVKDADLTVAWLGSLPKSTSMYTFADGFCGAGGVSLAAQSAKLHIQWAFDQDAQALETYEENINSNGPYAADANSMISIMESEEPQAYHVSILHLSPPCQPYSSANTRPNLEKNAVNQATLLTVGELIRLVKPRVVTLEQTSGIVSHHPHWFNKLINMITDNGYSVSYRVIRFDEYGLAQKRRRVIVYASCPGGSLPTFPEPTHGEYPPLQPYTTIKDVIGPIDGFPPNTIPRHDPTPPRNYVRRPSYDASTPLRFTMTTTGSEDYHPSGLRNFTTKEYSLLQGFPMHFVFPNQTDTTLRRQLGNAVPPSAFEPFLRSAALALENEDLERA